MPTDQASQDLLLQLHQSILHSAGEGIYGLNADGRANFVNPAAQEILGWTEDDLLGEFIHDFHHHSREDGRPYPKEECPIYAALNDGEVHRSSDEVFWHKNGRAVPVTYVSTPILVDDEVRGAVVVFTDISARRLAEQERKQALDEISRLNRALESERDYLRGEVSTAQNFGEIIGNSEAIQHTMRQIDAVADTDASVLILGESGVGKELVAREIHLRSDRSNAPLISVNCAAIAADLFESEFFGHVRGAFTGAHSDRMGRFQLADGGTLFLDEVGDIPLPMQGKLLRALQEQEFERIGEAGVRRVDVRIIAATNRNLKEDVVAGRFREDLYYRLNVFPIEVPPLRNRTADILPLALHFLNQNIEKLQKPKLKITRDQAELLSNYSWPGNVRELQHVVARAAILASETAITLDLATLPKTTAVSHVSARGGQPATATYLTESDLRDMERKNLIHVLNSVNWRVSGEGGAADLLGIKPTTLEYRMRRMDIRRPK